MDDLVRRQGWMEGVGNAVQGLVGGVYRVLGAPGRMLKNLLHRTLSGAKTQSGGAGPISVKKRMRLNATTGATSADRSSDCAFVSGGTG